MGDGPGDRMHYFLCPQCGDGIQILEGEFNCRIFRHAALKANGQQINPHAPRAECERLHSAGLIWGCGKPFRIVNCAEGGYKAEICDYI